jgi:ABC-type multidrug transport system ATPase subunit
MGELIGLDHVAISPEGATLSMGISAGQWIGIYGPVGSGKSTLLSVLGGRERPTRGVVTTQASVFSVEPVANPRKTKPLQLARRGTGPHFASVATEALIASRLWDFRNTPVSQLSSGQAIAAELLPALTSGASFIVCDGQLDRLDPWTLNGMRKHLRKLREQGTGLMVTTNRPDLALEFDVLLVLSKGEVKYAGPPQDLIRRTRSHVILVEADDQAGVKALVQPFSISVRESAPELRLEAEQGQELAAELLLKGYGNVRAVIHRPPTIEEALLELIQ